VNARQLLTALRDSIGSAYPARVAELSRHTGQVAATIAPTRCEYETGVLCEPVPMQLLAEVTVVAGSHSEAGVLDLLDHVDQIAALIRAAGWVVAEWTPDSIEDQAAVVITATAQGEG